MYRDLFALPAARAVTCFTPVEPHFTPLGSKQTRVLLEHRKLTWADTREGSMAVFRSRGAAEEFVREDPFVLHGVVASHEVRDLERDVARLGGRGRLRPSNV